LNDLYLKRGIVFKKEKKIDFKRIHLLSTKVTLLTKFFDASKLYLDTSAGSSKKPDVTLTLKESRAQSLFSEIFPEKNIKYSYKANIFKIIILSLSFANPVSGLLILIPFINKTSKILGENFKNEIYSNINSERINFTSLGIPPLASSLIHVLIIGWIVAFFVQFFKYFNFTAECSEEILFIKHGIIEKNIQAIRLKKINAVMIKQSLFMKFFNLKSVYIKSIGYGKEKYSRNLLIAAERNEVLKEKIKNITGFNSSIKNKIFIKPGKETFLSFIFAPVLFFLLLASSIIFLYFLNYLFKLFLLIFIFLSILNIFWVAFKIFAYKKSGIFLDEKKLLIKSYEKFSVYLAIVPFEKIQVLEITQNFLQEKKNLVNIKVYIFAENKEFFKIINLNKQLVNNFLKEFQNKMLTFFKF